MEKKHTKDEQYDKIQETKKKGRKRKSQLENGSL
jgi:hypothetical protein